jgi:class 3 adenylate cyclase
MPQRTNRRLATVLFLDIVGSTGIAAEIGDRRWRDLLSRFQGIVRGQLKRFGGHEEDTTGDGFFATFEHPASAIHAAAAIAGAVQEVGLDVRTGLHTGECEFVDGKLAGIAVHIAARVMALGGAAEILTTSTVRDLVTGSEVQFEPFGSHDLKGVPGTWQVFSVARVSDGAPPLPLDPAEAAELIAAVEPPPLLKRRRVQSAVAAAVLLIAGAVAFVLLRGEPERPVARTITLVRIDPTTGRIVGTLRDAYYSHHMPGSLYSADGSLWQVIPGRVVRRTSGTGAPQLTIAVGEEVDTGAPGFGSAWTGSSNGITSSVIRRYDEASGRRQAEIRIPDFDVVSMSGGSSAMWALSSDGSLAKIDPLTNAVSRVVHTRTQAPGIVVALDNFVWICDCEVGSIVQFDPRTGSERRFDLPVHGFLIDVDDAHGHTLWALDPTGNTLTSLDPVTGEPGQPLGFGGHVGQAVIGFGNLWVAASNAVYRIDLATGEQRKVEIPLDMTAGSIAVDEQTGTVWVGNCGCPRNG